jgi:DNA-binding PadR family transcriptional regulator
MEYYVITESGKQAIQQLKGAINEEEAKILGYLDRAGNATVEQIAYAVHLEELAAQEKLKSLIANRWVWLNKTRFKPF